MAETDAQMTRLHQGFRDCGKRDVYDFAGLKEYSASRPAPPDQLLAALRHKEKAWDAIARSGGGSRVGERMALHDRSELARTMIKRLNAPGGQAAYNRTAKRMQHAEMAERAKSVRVHSAPARERESKQPARSNAGFTATRVGRVIARAYQAVSRTVIRTLRNGTQLHRDLQQHTRHEGQAEPAPGNGQGTARVRHTVPHGAVETRPASFRRVPAAAARPAPAAPPRPSAVANEERVRQHQLKEAREHRQRAALNKLMRPDATPDRPTAPKPGEPGTGFTMHTPPRPKPTAPGRGAAPQRPNPVGAFRRSQAAMQQTQSKVQVR